MESRNENLHDANTIDGKLCDISTEFFYGKLLMENKMRIGRIRRIREQGANFLISSAIVVHKVEAVDYYPAKARNREHQEHKGKTYHRYKKQR